MRISNYGIALLVFCMSSPLTICAQTPKPGVNQNKTRRKTRVDVKYDKSKDVSTVRLEEVVLWKNPGIFEEVSMGVSFEYPKRIIVIPKSVLLTFSSATKDRKAFVNDDFAVVIDNTKKDLGPLERWGNRDLTPRPGFVFERVRVSVPYGDFVEMARAKTLSLAVGGSTYDLTASQLQLLADFLQLMQQEGQEFK